jgi:hypothetical protein
MAEDLSGVTNKPYTHRIASVSTTWTEIKIPNWATKISLMGPSAECYVAFVGPETPTDGGAVGSHYLTIAADSAWGTVIFDCDDNPTTPNVTKAASVFVASVSGTSSVSVHLECGRE